MAQTSDPDGSGAEAQRSASEASSVTMDGSEEMLRRIITTPPGTYEEVKLGKRRRREGTTNGSVRHRALPITRAKPKAR